MLSRVANSIYWMNRYFERADNVARFIDVNLRLIMDAEQTHQAQWQPLVQASGDNLDFDARYISADEKSVITFLTFDAKNPNSILSCVQAARENARTVREIIPTEQWEVMNELYHFVQKFGKKRHIHNLQGFYAEIKKACNIFIGLAENVILHDESWHFARMGRMLERADKTTRLLDVKYFLLLPTPEDVGSVFDNIEWGAVLGSVNAHEMYRKQFHRVNYQDVTQFLLFDPYFPRSIVFCVECAERSLAWIVEHLQVKVLATQEIATLQSQLHSTTIQEVLKNGLHEFLDIVQYNLNIVDHAIHESFFALKEV